MRTAMKRQITHARSLREAFLHFLQMRASSVLRFSSWSLASAWHCGQSNQRLQQLARMLTCAFGTCLHMGGQLQQRRSELIKAPVKMAPKHFAASWYSLAAVVYTTIH
jgi:hypothetical protein